MPATLPAGPYRVLQTVEGQALPYYVLPFDGDGVCTGPQTLQHLLDAADGYSDIFVFHCRRTQVVSDGQDETEVRETQFSDLIRTTSSHLTAHSLLEMKTTSRHDVVLRLPSLHCHPLHPQQHEIRHTLTCKK